MSDIPVGLHSIPTRMGVRIDPFGEPGHARIDVFPEICHRGQIRPSALMLMVDMVAGLLDDVDDPEAWHFTTDFSMRTVPVPLPARVEADVTRLRLGSTMSVTETRIVDQDGRLVAHSHIGFARKVLRPGDPPKPSLKNLRDRVVPPDIDTPLVEATGIRVVDAATGHITVELTDDLRQPAGMMQGAMVSLMGEVAAETLADHDLGSPHVVADLDIRYLVGGRDGPMTATASWIGDPSTGWLDVRLFDEGRDRLTTVFTVRVRPA
ncbi:MAG: hypothetical protein KDB21_02170 [Acidimicrobiales bacterium]|nr:hypothetical protein [Acidimicrobiales bacterium]